MKGKALFAAARDARGLREQPGGPLRAAQPSRVDDIREARFDAYRARADGPPTEPADEQATTRAEAAREAPPTGRDPEAWRALNDAAAAYRERLAAARSEEAKPAADRADVTQRGIAAVRDALRHHP